jgi:hypothetical protein
MTEPPADLLSAKDIPEPAIATLYRASVSLGTQETQLVWARYTGFLILNGFLINAYIASWTEHLSGEAPKRGAILFAIGILGLLVNAIWHVLNFSGWQNQNLFYYQAANVSDVFSRFQLPTDPFKQKVHRPYGWIYWLAQCVPIGLSISATAGIVLAASYLLGTIHCVIVFTIGLAWVIVAILVLVIETVIHRHARKFPV